MLFVEETAVERFRHKPAYYKRIRIRRSHLAKKFNRWPQVAPFAIKSERIVPFLMGIG